MERQHQPVRRVLDGAAAEVGVALEDDVARADLVVEGFQQQRHVGTELAHEHVPGGVGHERELVVLLPDDGRHRRLQDDGVHLLADVQQRALDDLEGCEVHGGGRAGHRRSSGMISTFSQASVAATWPGMDERRGVRLHDDCRSRDNIPRPEPVALVHPCLQPTAPAGRPARRRSVRRCRPRRR